jgi:hypothetical protein
MHAKKLIAVALLAACGDDPKECFTPTVSAATCDPAQTMFSLATTNPYFPLRPGNISILEGTEGGVPVRVERRVLGETETIMGVRARVLEIRVLRDGVLREVARNYHAEAKDGTVCHFGGDVDEYENGQVVSHDGSWRAGVHGAKPGVSMPPEPMVGDAFFQEVAPGVAQRQGRVTAVGGTMTYAGMSFTGVVSIAVADPLAKGAPCAEQTKHYAPGVGEVDDGVTTLVSYTIGMDPPDPGAAST